MAQICLTNQTLIAYEYKRNFHITFTSAQFTNLAIHSSLNSEMVLSVLVQNKAFLKRLKESKFDLAFAEHTGLCSIGLIHAAQIPAWIWMNNAAIIDYIANIVGLHTPSSYVPRKVY